MRVAIPILFLTPAFFAAAAASRADNRSGPYFREHLGVGTAAFSCVELPSGIPLDTGNGAGHVYFHFVVQSPNGKKLAFETGLAENPHLGGYSFFLNVAKSSTVRELPSESIPNVSDPGSPRYYDVALPSVRPGNQVCMEARLSGSEVILDVKSPSSGKATFRFDSPLPSATITRLTTVADSDMNYAPNKALGPFWARWSEGHVTRPGGKRVPITRLTSFDAKPPERWPAIDGRIVPAWNGQTVEVFINPDGTHKPYKQDFAANPAGSFRGQEPKASVPAP